MRCRTLTLWAPLFAALCLFQTANASPPTGPSVHRFREAGSLYFSQRGIELLTHSIQDALASQNILLDHGSFSDYTYESPTAIPIRELDASLGENRGLLIGLRTQLAHWLNGFTLRNPRISIQARGIRYTTRGLGLHVYIDPQASTALGTNNGILARVEVEVPEFRIEIDSIRVRDLANRFLGFFGFNQVFVSYRNPQKPLKISLDLRLMVGTGGHWQMEVLGSRSNFASLRVRSGFNRNVILPRVELQVGDQRMVLDPAPIRLAIEETRAPFVEMMLARMDRLMQDRVPDLIHDWVTLRAAETLSHTLILPPAGRSLTQGDAAGGEPLPYFFALSSLGAQNLTQHGTTAIRLALTGHWPNLGPNESAARATISTVSQLTDLSPEDYDFALTVPLTVFNALIRDAYYQGAIPAPPSQPGQAGLRFRGPPQILRPLAGGNGDLLEVILPLERDPQGVQETVTFDGPIQIDMVAKVRLKTLGALNELITIEIAQYDTIASRIRLTNQRLGTFLAPQVNQQFRETLNTLNRELSAHPIRLLQPTNLSLPLSPYAVSVKKVSLDPNRLIVFYLEYLAGAGSRAGARP